MTIKRGRENKGKNIKAPIVEDTSIDLKKPAFSLEYLSKERNYSLQDCSKEQKAQIINKLNTLSQMTWREIRNANRKGLGQEKIARSSYQKRCAEASNT